MQFTQIPQQYAPLGGELRYAVGQAAAGNIDIRIVDAAAGSRTRPDRSVTEAPCWVRSGSQR